MTQNVVDLYKTWSDLYDQYNTPSGNLDVIDVEHRVIADLLSSLPSGNALDAACGTGRWAKYLHDNGWNLTLVDHSASMLNVAQSKFINKRNNVNFIISDVRHLPLDSNIFDLIICSFALMHVSEIDIAIQEFIRVLKLGGTLIISDIHPSLQREWGNENIIEIGDSIFPFVGLHFTPMDYKKPIESNAMRIVGELHLPAISQGKKKLAVYIVVAAKCGQ